MAENASKDENGVSTLIAVSSVDGKTPVKVYANPTTHRLLVSPVGGATGTFTTADAKTVTVTNGVVTSIV